jgi:putative ABC transport system ATP-binding protein
MNQILDADLANNVPHGAYTLSLAPRPSPLARFAAVLCRGVTKEFVTGETRVQALRGVDLEVRAGEMTLLIGPSGCGKTTLISVIAALLNPTAGEVEVLGTSLTELTARQRVDFRRQNIGFVFQQYNLLPALTAAENVAVPLVIAGWKRAQAVARARDLLEAVRLTDRADALPAHLSGGQQQRVAIARALVHEPRLLVCDEPTAALDAELGHSVMDMIRQVAVKADRAVIIVTHDSRVFGFGDRIVSMNDGRVERVESPQVPGKEGMR